jgi:hypothetical protein
MFGKSNGSVVGSYRANKSGTKLTVSVYGEDPHDTFKATYEDSTTYFGGGSGPAYVGTFGPSKGTPRSHERYSAELIPNVIAGC